MLRLRLPDVDSLGALAWLVEAGADEAIGEAPVNRFQAKASAPHPPLEGGSKSAQQISGRGDTSASETPPRKILAQRRSDFSTLPQGEGGKSGPTFTQSAAPKKPRVTPTSVLN